MRTPVIPPSPAPASAGAAGPTVLLFVYGTLKQGFPNHHLNRGRRLPGVFRTCLPHPLHVVRLPHEDRAPWLLDAPGQGLPVQGEVYEVDAADLPAIDRLEEEGRPGGYRRQAVDLEDPADPARRLTAFAYLKPPDDLAQCLAQEGPFDIYTPALARGYWLGRLHAGPPPGTPVPPIALPVLPTALPGCVLRPWQPADRDALVRLADDRSVWRNMADVFPHPYTLADADGWIALASTPSASLHLAITVDGAFAGGIGAIAGSGVHCASADFGYWLGQPFWGRGIATAAARTLADHLLGQRHFVRLQATVYAWNPASVRVLEKAGFQREGVRRLGVLKDGCLVDGWLLGRVADDD